MIGSNYLALCWTCTLYPVDHNAHLENTQCSCYFWKPDFHVPWGHKWISWCRMHIDLFWNDVLCRSLWGVDKPYSYDLASKKDRKQVISLPGKTGLMWNSPCLWGLWKMPRGQDARWFSKILIKLWICCFYSPRKILN